MVDPHDVVMTGENSFVRLSADGGKSLTARASHWRVLWSPAGQGHALFLQREEARPRIFSDNAGLARYLQRTIEVLLHKPFADESIPVADARFERSGHSLATVEERVVAGKEEILLAWWDLIEPFVLTMPPGAMGRPLGVYSTFIPARSAQLTVDGVAAPGAVFPQERFGKPSSSCCLAWSETWTRPRA